MIIRGIIAGAVILVVFFAIFFRYILNLKSDIDSEFPSSGTSVTTTRAPSETTAPSSEDTSSEATSESTTETPPSDTTPSESATEPDGTSDTTAPEGDATTETGDPSDPEATTTTSVSLLPDDWSDHPTVLLPEKYPLQTVTHAERDQSFAALKHAVKKYLEDHSDARIGFYYINLSTNEYFGYNEAAPFVVGSSIYLPLTMMLYDDARAGLRSLDMVIPYSPSYAQEKTTSNMNELPEGKQFFLRQLAYLALSEGDSTAMAMVISNLGGMDSVMARLSQMSSCIDFSSVQNYFDFQGIQQSGEHRSSAYDLASYAQKLYWRYMSYPVEYQDLIDALAASDRTQGVGRQIPNDVLVLHRGGSNAEFHSECDVAIIIGDEPVVVSVTVEAETPEKAEEIQAALGALVYNFINNCHA